MKLSFNNKTCSSGSNCKHNKDDLALDSRPKQISDTPLRLVHCGLRLGPMEYVSWYFFSKTISPKILAKRKKKSPVSTWLMLWTEVHMHLNCDSHVCSSQRPFRETRRPGRFWPEQGTPAASVREVQSPGLTTAAACNKEDPEVVSTLSHRVAYQAIQEVKSAKMFM